MSFAKGRRQMVDFAATRVDKSVKGSLSVGRACVVQDAAAPSNCIDELLQRSQRVAAFKAIRCSSIMGDVWSRMSPPNKSDRTASPSTQLVDDGFDCAMLGLEKLVRRVIEADRISARTAIAFSTRLATNWRNNGRPRARCALRPDRFAACSKPNVPARNARMSPLAGERASGGRFAYRLVLPRADFAVGTEVAARVG